ncbi:prostasin-like [Physella acuta]|uniref:prostasin-like n=1 Tax=Physella acuta TaxID=109671 RepID=UPI0027DC61FE|nr:prostasin-like [Physella acuta]
MVRWLGPSYRPSPFPNHPDCGSPAVDVSRSIINGTDAPAKAWPWVAILSSSNAICVAILINHSWLLTAAHCVHDYHTYTVTLGMNTINDFRNNPNIVTRKLAFKKRHENYNKRSIWNDIAVLKMQTPVDFTDYIRPICLPFRHIQDDKHCYVAGWGFTTPHGVYPKTLQQLKTYFFDQSLCYYIWNFFTLPPNDKQFCMGIPEGGGECRGDSGGPLSCSRDGRFYLVGVHSFGARNCIANYLPPVYTKVYAHLDWINEQIKTHNELN